MASHRKPAPRTARKSAARAHALGDTTVKSEDAAPPLSAGPTAKGGPKKSMAGGSADPMPWTPHAPGVCAERDPRTGSVRSLMHAGQPYVASCAGIATDVELLAIAGGYLRAANELLQIPQAWLDDLADANPGPQFFALGWTQFDGDPRNSFRCERRGAGGNLVVETAVAIAAFQLLGITFHGGQGLRVTLHIDHGPHGKDTVRVTSVTSSLPMVSPDFTNLSPPGEPIVAALAPFASLLPALDVLLKKVGSLVADAAGMPEGTEFVDYRLQVPEVGESWEKVFGEFKLAMKSVVPDARPELLSYQLETRPQLIDGALAFVVDRKVALVTHAAAPPAQAKIFALDPVTRKGKQNFRRAAPHHAAGDLDGERIKVTLPRVQPSGVYGRYLLTDANFVDVVISPLDPGAPNVGGTREFDPVTSYASRSNTQAAVNAYFHFESLVLRMQQYGFDVDDYLKFAETPLQIAYRGGIQPGGRSGKTVNAQVRWRIRPDATTGPGIGVLATSLALADLRISPEKAPLGIACDPRWLWHEFGHVLLAGATGDLEFRFAHSAGDAMAAIVHDPLSALSNESAWRGRTFPWVTLPGRRHDREASRGWSWSGTFNGRERDFAVGVSDRRGYWTEQILSSSLFTMYRALGGDALTSAHTPDKTTRWLASHHALFLIMKAMQLIGPATGVPSSTPENFANALIDADIGTTSLAPPAAVAVPARQGGFAHKVIRWAFERQGAYPDPTKPFPSNAAGLPPAVDIFIDSGVPTARRGTYEPVTFLDGDWHARPSAVWVQRAVPGLGVDEEPLYNEDNYVYVRVENRGAGPASDVEVEVHVAKGAMPRWPDAKWKTLAATGTSVADVPAAPGGTIFGPFVWKKPKRGSYAILVTATCSDDRANTDPASGWSCATSPTKQALALRVACDNNLGLRVVVVK